MLILCMHMTCVTRVPELPTRDWEGGDYFRHWATYSNLIPRPLWLQLLISCSIQRCVWLCMHMMCVTRVPEPAISVGTIQEWEEIEGGQYWRHWTTHSSFIPRTLWPQCLITCSMQRQRGKAWWILPCDLRHSWLQWFLTETHSHFISAATAKLEEQNKFRQRGRFYF